MKTFKYLLAAMLAWAAFAQCALASPQDFGGWTRGSNNQITGVLNQRGVITPFIQYNTDPNGYNNGMLTNCNANGLTPCTVNGFSGFVPPTRDYPGIMAALRAAIAAPNARNVLFEDATYNIGSNYIPIVGGIGYIGVPTRIAFTNGGWVGKSHFIVGGSIINGTGSYIFWDGETSQGAVTATVAAQTATTVSGSTSVTVTNGSLFTVGGRVYVPQGQAGGGFYTGIAYYVLSISGNVLTLGLPDMVAIPATSSATIQLSAGFPNDGDANVFMRYLACNSCSTLIKTGAPNVFGLIYSSIDDVFVIGTTTARAMDNQNYNQIRACNINTNDSDGQYWGANYPSASFQMGNSDFCRLFNSNNGAGDNNFAQHNIIFQAETGSILNEVRLESAQNSTSYISTQTVTTSALTNGSANIPVANSAIWPVGLPVWITTTANGFTQNLTYWVVSSAANVIQLSATKGGTAQNSTGTSTMVINSQGYPHLEMQGVGTGTITDSKVAGLDLEGNATNMASMQHANVTITDIGQASSADGHVTFEGRAFSGLINNPNAIASSDWDSSSNNGYIGQLTTSYNTWHGYGLGYDASIGSGAYWMNLNANASPGFPSCYGVNISNGGFIYCGNPVVDKVRSSDTSKTFGGASDGGITVFNGATGQTYTLPVLSNTSTSSTYVGMRYTVINASTNSLTVATQSSQTFNNQSGQTSMTLTAGQWATYIGGLTAGGTLFWIVTGNATL